ncbi:MAG: hypothetical protein HYU37_15995 [Acidobacteria bacterium]|nr:hypothetical protein [Acidobacteriota bacterium]
MQERSVRLVVLTLLLATPLAAAFFLWNIDRRAAASVDASDAVAGHVDRMRDAIAEIGAAQQGYVAPGQLDEPWFERSTAQVEALRGEVAAVRPLLRSSSAAAVLDGLAQSLEALEAADARTRENLSLGQDLMAADVIFSDGRNILDGMAAQMRELQRAERAAAAAEREALAQTRWTAVGLVLLVSFAAIGWAIRVSGVPKVPEVRSGTPGTATIDLSAAAALCTDLSRVTETAALRPLVERAASLVDASGLTLWMSGGEQLFAVLSHGYAVEQLARFGPIARSADNAVAAAWRTGRLSVMAGDTRAPGALVAPMFGPNGGIGVLAFEIRDGREQDPAVQAVATMVAAQLATAVAAWPAASSADTPATAHAARTA